MTTLKITYSLVIAGALVVTAACGDSNSSMNPVAPSAVVIGAQSDESGDPGAVSGVNAKGGNGKDKDKDKDKDKGNGKQPNVPAPPTVPGSTTPTNTTPPAPVTKKVELEGLITAKNGTTITVNGQVVTVPSTAVIRKGNRTYKFSDLKVGNRVHVKAMRQASSTTTSAASTSLMATEVKLQNPGDASDDGDEDDPSASKLVSVTASDATAAEAGLNPGAFRLTRSGDLTAALTVTFTLTGTATRGTDYEDGLLTVEFTAGQATATVTITPKTDTDAEGAESVILTVVDGNGYTAGAPATATVMIAG